LLLPDKSFVLSHNLCLFVYVVKFALSLLVAKIAKKKGNHLLFVEKSRFGEKYLKSAPVRKGYTGVGISPS
jgi:hypothetical protein